MNGLSNFRYGHKFDTIADDDELDGTDSTEIEFLQELETREYLYSLKLFQIGDFNSLKVLRVPGGWIFSFGPLITKSNIIFVPYSPEFILSDVEKDMLAGVESNEYDDSEFEDDTTEESEAGIEKED